MQQSDEEKLLSPVSILEDNFSKFLQNAKVDMSSVSPYSVPYKKVRFKDDSEVRWITSPNANTEYLISEKSYCSIGAGAHDEESSVRSISIEEILHANQEYVKMKIKTGKEVIITKVITLFLKKSIAILIIILLSLFL